MAVGEICLPHAAIKPRRPGKVWFVCVSSDEEFDKIVCASESAQTILKAPRSRWKAAVSAEYILSEVGVQV